LPEEFRNGFAAVVIGGQYNTKIFPELKVVETCLALDYPVIIIGGASDYSRGKSIAEKVGENVWNSCGKLTLGQSASILKMADVVLTNDTGMMHIAAALHKPIVSIWGNTVPEFGMYPYLPKERDKFVIVECKGLKCRPCHKLGYEKCPKKHFKCMMDLDAKQVAKEMVLLKERFAPLETKK
jgi:ADP-heptose:LPS heptosyltransferase